MQKISAFALGLCTLLCVFSCNKINPPKLNCAEYQRVRITTSKTQYYVGEPIDLTVNEVLDGFYSWRHSSIPNDLSTTEALHVDYATKDYQGWFYLTVANPDCSSAHDSIYIEVINKPVDAPCDPVNNTANFSSIPDISFSNATYGINNSYNRKYISGYKAYGYPDIIVYFHPYWLDKEPEDGEYDMGSGGIGFGSSNIYEVFITSLYGSVLFQATGGKAYVKHINGKLQVTFCDVPLTGISGSTALSTAVTGKLTAP